MKTTRLQTKQPFGGVELEKATLLHRIEIVLHKLNNPFTKKTTTNLSAWKQTF